MTNSNITFVLTSCGRLDLLEKTLDSFFKYNTYPIDKFIITEDSANEEVFKACEILNQKYDNKLTFIYNKSKLGQSRSIDSVYVSIKTPYVFHCEDDWEFYAGGFIEKSIQILESRPEVLQAWIRPKSDGHFSEISPEIFWTGSVPFRTVQPVSFYTGAILENGQKEIVINYMGFSYNPGVKRMSDYFKLGSGGYSQFGREHLVDHHYRDLGYKVVSMSVNDSDGYVKHLGFNRRVENTIF